MFKYFAKRRLRQYGYVYLEKYKMWYQHEFLCYVTDKWVCEFPVLVKEFCVPYYKVESEVSWKNTPNDTRFLSRLAEEIKQYYEDNYLNKPKLSQVIPILKELK